MKEKIRICFLGNGESIHTQRWVRHFSESGHDVHLISSTKATFDKATVHLVEGKGYTDFIRKIFKCRKIVKEIKPDVIHAHFVTDYGFLGAMTGFHPFVVSPWGSDIVWQPEESALFRVMVKYALRKADIIQCGDQNVAARVNSLIGDRGTVRRVGWGVDTENFNPSGNRESDEIRILYLRISHDKYRTWVLLEAMPEILKKHSNVKFIILKNGEHLDRTLEAVRKMSAPDNIELIDPVPYSEMPALLNSCDIYIDTAYSELPGCGVGMTALEAMSCGLPVVVTDTNGCAESVTHMANGYVYKGLDPKSLAHALDELISDRGLREKLGTNAREHIMNTQSWQKNMAAMEKIYIELINKGGAK